MQNAVNIIKQFEGYSSTPYYATENERLRGILTIGYGTTLINNRRVETNDFMDLHTAEQHLIKHCEALQHNIATIIPDLEINQYEALVSLVYNIGLGAFKDSTLAKRLKNQDNIRIDINDFPKLKKDIESFNDRADNISIDSYSEFHKWIYQQGAPLFGLLRRREAEWELFKKKNSYS